MLNKCCFKVIIPGLNMFQRWQQPVVLVSLCRSRRHVSVARMSLPRMLMCFVTSVNQRRNRYTLRENKKCVYLKRTMRTYGYNAKDVRDRYMKIYCAVQETAPYFIEESKLRKILKKTKRYSKNS